MSRTRVRVYLFTYRRNGTLVRSIESLRRQTFGGWVCEIHNDEPTNIFPADHIASLGDARFTVVNHPANLGPTKTFNMAFGGCPEEFISILEDDNWWEPDFLSTMLGAMDEHPEVQVAWANLRIWRESAGDQWTDTGQTVWPAGDQAKLLHFPQYRQAYTALHSNGAMLVRNSDLAQLRTPEAILFDFAETIRERAYRHPLLLVSLPLANFAQTVSTGRSASFKYRQEHCLLLIDSFLQCVPISAAGAEKLWTEVRGNGYRSYLMLMYTGLCCRSSRKLLGKATALEWFNFILYNIRHPSVLSGCLRAKTVYAELWHYLLENTKARVREQEQRS
ncbi:glycosyltransferase family 2 protein [Mucilaginibacter ginsenosidivorans]|uniref:Glycosyltransferase family 2 protein n=1 Tax=Mucilaginibacter ginsenosidivorans TaxID=398053 RepID=A0A5B8UTY3_9SPHI|nr:glycosyltransferase [Mucilaginibacter ginsenosidivorans]QEC62570.1 glycosyltransferase family 2 protein [Mucilaginibacter ginsenosidivorans]